MPAVARLPYEVIASVLRNLDNVRFLLPPLLTCRHFYTSFKEYPIVKGQVFRRQVTPALLPYSIAVLEASRLPRPHTGASIQALLDTLYNEPAQLVARFDTMPLPALLKMGRTHDAIESFVGDFATHAWARLSQDDPGLSSDLVLSPKEYFRFCRAFYRVELFFNLFRGTEGRLSDAPEVSEIDWFLSRHAPWENEQLACVHDFLERKLFEASFDVVAHDVEFGEFSIDYLTRGSENHWMQQWISQGIIFSYQLINDSSYETKKALLKSAFSASGAQLHDAFSALSDDTTGNDNALDDYTEEEIQALVPRSDDQDTDKGPYEAWHSAHGYLPRGAWVMFSDTAGLRERAYVLWDLDRIEKHNMLDVFANVPENASHTHTNQDFDDMRDSFDERSKIWQKGGSGYWSKHDTSKIVWPGKPA